MKSKSNVKKNITLRAEPSLEDLQRLKVKWFEHAKNNRKLDKLMTTACVLGQKDPKLSVYTFQDQLLYIRCDKDKNHIYVEYDGKCVCDNAVNICLYVHADWENISTTHYQSARAQIEAEENQDYETERLKLKELLQII